MSKQKQEYGNESIVVLKGPDMVRVRPSVIFGSKGIEGCQHSFFEILSNSIDEAREGHGNQINVTYYADNSIEVEDFGRGCPVDYNPVEKRMNWELVFCELYAGGKYKNNQGGDYEYSLGTNGLGSCATQFASEYMDVTVWRDDNKYTLHFEKGFNIGGLKTEPTDRKKTGSLIKWKPDLEVFTDVAIPLEFLLDVFKRQAVVNAGLRFKLRYQTPTGFETYEFVYENGIVDYLTELVQNHQLTELQYYSAERTGRDRENMAEYKVKLSLAFYFTNKNNIIEHYHNSSFLEHGGATDKAVRSAFVSSIDGYLRQTGKYQKGESKITFPDVADSLLLVTNCFSTETGYEGQTKKAIDNKFIQEAMTEFLRSQLEIYFIENKAEAEKIAQQILINKRSRETAEKTRQAVKTKLTGSLDINNRVQKFVDCRTKDLDKREIYIVEGDSALGACKLGRDAEFQAIIPVRGKILNCLKAEYDKIFKNDIITDLIKVLGCGIEVTGKFAKGFESFDLSKLRWNKVIICTDADVDGFQIRALILTMIYRLVPSLIDKGYVYIAESPLYEITCKDQTWFAYTEAEKNNVVKELEGKKYQLQRSKGLGENEPEMMWQTTMNPETRKLVKVMPDMAGVDTDVMFDVLLGDNLQGRKDFIAEHGSKYLEATFLS